MKTRHRPKIGTDGRPATTGEMIYPQRVRKDARTNPAPGRWTALAGTPQHEIEWLIPSDSADFLDPRPRQALYTSPIVIPGGVSVDLNSPTAVHEPQPPRYRHTSRTRACPFDP